MIVSSTRFYEMNQLMQHCHASRAPVLVDHGGVGDVRGWRTEVKKIWLGECMRAYGDTRISAVS